MCVNTNSVIPAEAGIQYVNPIRRIKIQDASHIDTHWIPASAGMTGVGKTPFKVLVSV